MEVPEERLKGKRAILKTFRADTQDVNIPRIQVLMKRANNCKASSWKCLSCPIGRLAKCFAKVSHELSKEAFLKYRDRPEYKKEQEKINKELISSSIKI